MSSVVGYSGITADGAGFTGTVPVNTGPSVASPHALAGYSGITTSGAGFTGAVPVYGGTTRSAGRVGGGYNGLSAAGAGFTGFAPPPTDAGGDTFDANGVGYTGAANGAGYTGLIVTGESEGIVGADYDVVVSPSLAAPQFDASREAELDEIEARYRDKIELARALGFDVAAGNLQHWLDGVTDTRFIDADWLRSFNEVTDAQMRNHSYFEQRLLGKAQEALQHGDAFYSDYFDARVRAGPFSELFYASGISQLKSAGSFTLQRQGDTVHVVGQLQHDWFDPYDWNKSQGARVPGFGWVPDDDALRLRDGGRGRDYMLRGGWSESLVGSVTVGADGGLRPVWDWSSAD